MSADTDNRVSKVVEGFMESGNAGFSKPGIFWIKLRENAEIHFAHAEPEWGQIYLQQLSALLHMMESMALYHGTKSLEVPVSEQVALINHIERVNAFQCAGGHWAFTVSPPYLGGKMHWTFSIFSEKPDADHAIEVTAKFVEHLYGYPEEG